MTSSRIRTASPDDAAVVGVLFDLYRQFYEQAPDLERARRYIAERLSRQESMVLVAESPDLGMVGFCQLYATFCSVEAAPIHVLYDLFVKPEGRGRGVGRQLMLAAEAHAHEAGSARLDLSTARTNTTAQALYESLGWVRDQTYFVYSKSLGTAPAP